MKKDLKKKNKQLGFAAGILIGFLVLMYFTIGYPIVIDNTEDYQAKNSTETDSISLFKDFDFKTGEWSAYLYLNNEDFDEANTALLPGKVYKTQNHQLLEQMKNKFVFKVSDADLATVQSVFYLYGDDSLVFKSHICLDENQQGFQSQAYGWLKFQDRETGAIFRKFEKLYRPILLLEND